MASHHERSYVAEQSSVGAHSQTGEDTNREPIASAENKTPASIPETAGSSQGSANANAKSGASEHGLVGQAGQANGSGNPGNTNGVKRVATQAQQRALHAIANKLSMDLESELRSRFGIRYVSQISLRQASGLIDELKSLQAQSGAAV